MTLSREQFPHVCSSFASSDSGYQIIKGEPLAPSAQRGAPVLGEPQPGWTLLGRELSLRTPPVSTGGSAAAALASW